MITEHLIVPREIHEFQVHGTCDVNEVIAIIGSRYRAISKGILWTLVEGSITHFTAYDMRRLAAAVKTHAVHHKTAYCGDADEEYGMFRMYESYAGLAEVQPAMKVFRNRADALDWLMEAVPLPQEKRMRD